MKLIVFVLMAFSVNLYASVECDKLNDSKRLKKLVDQIQKYQDNTSVWPGQKLSEFTYVLTDLEVTNNCALVLYDNFKKKLISTRDPIEYRNTLYSFYTEYSPSKNIEIKEFLEQSNISIAYAQNFTDVLSQIPPNQIRILGLGNGNFYLSLLIHEGFHLFTQFDDNNWLRWVSNVSFNRDEVTKKCYQDKRVVSIFEKEFEDILSVYQSLEFFNDSQLATDAFHDYYNYREERYKLLHDVKIHDTINDTYITCKEAEIVMEKREGLAEFNSNMGMLNSGLMNENHIFASLRNKINSDTFYAIGMVKQLFLYRKLGRSYIQTVYDMLSRDDSQFDQDYYIKMNL